MDLRHDDKSQTLSTLRQHCKQDVRAACCDTIELAASCNCNVLGVFA